MASFERLHLVNTYGAFGSVTRDRYEIIIEGNRLPIFPPTPDVAANTNSRASPAIHDAARASCRHITGRSTGRCGSPRCQTIVITRGS